MFQDVKKAVVSYADKRPILNLIMKISPILIFLKPVADILKLIVKDGGFYNFLSGLDAIFLILFVVGILFSFMTDKGIPLLGALVLGLVAHIWEFARLQKGLKEMAYFVDVSSGAASFNFFIYLLLYLGLIAVAVVQTARRGEFAKMSAQLKDYMAPKEQAAGVACPQCNHQNAAGVNFCTNCGGILPAMQAPVQQVVQQTPVTPPPVQNVQPTQPIQPAQPVVPTVDDTNTPQQ